MRHPSRCILRATRSPPCRRPPSRSSNPPPSPTSSPDDPASSGSCGSRNGGSCGSTARDPPARPRSCRGCRASTPRPGASGSRSSGAGSRRRSPRSRACGGRPTGRRTSTASSAANDGDRGNWRWILRIALPEEATDAELAAALAAGRSKLEPPFSENLRIERFDEGDAAQLPHLGSYADERPSIERLHAAIAEAGLVPRDRHHEIYLGDPRRSAPGKLRTLLRQPVGPAA